jgi:hypothetical protein
MITANIRLVTIVLVGLAAVLMAGNTASAPMPIAHGGKATCRIVVAGDASAVEKNAANELAVYLKKVTGATLAIVKPENTAGRPVIAVGPGAARKIAPKLLLNKSGDKGLGDDGIVIKTIGKNLVLTGAEGSKRGTLYAVYEFLEREVGVRWWTPEEEFVPRKTTLSIGQLNVRYKPAFLYRETLCSAIRPFIWEETDKVPMFALRMRQNGHFAKIPEDWGGHYTLLGWCHTFFGHDALMPPEKYFKDHPEWYSEINGKRKWEQAQLCMTNKAMLAELTRNVLDRIRKNPEAGMISVAQNDWGGNCQCASCKALDDAEGSPSGSLLYGINQVAEGVEKEFPEFYIETLAYLYTRKPPKTIRPRKNVIVRLSVIERSGVQTIENGVNLSLLADLEAWSKAAPNLYMWDYTANIWNPFTPEPRAFIYGPDMRLYKKRGVISVFCEHYHAQSPISDFDQLHTWLLSKYMWNPDQDDRTLIREFLNGYYGAAGDAIGRYLSLLTKKVGNRYISINSGAGEPLSDAEWMELETINQATKLFDLATKAVANDAVLTARMQRARLSLDHQWLRGYAGYKFISKQKRTLFNGPTDFDEALSRFNERCRALGVEGVGFDKDIPLSAFMDSVRLAGETAPARFILATNKTYQAFLAGAHQPLPPLLAKTPSTEVIDIQEDRMTMFNGAEVVFDTKASNAAAARIDPAVINWSVQLRDLAAKGVTGRFHAYAMVRVEALADKGVAFTGGVYDAIKGRNSIGISQRIEGNAGATSDVNTPTEQTVAIKDSVRDGEYHLYDLGTHNFHNDMYIWFGTTGGVDPRQMKAIYVDRVIFVKE